MFMAQSASDRLLDRVRPFKGDSVGISVAHINKMPLTTDAVADIFDCLRSDDPKEFGWGLWFAQGVLDSNPPRELLLFLVAGLPKWISHEKDDVREVALPLLIRLRENFRDYRSLMFKCLKDRIPMVRSKALGAYRTFLTEDDIPLLMEFQNDEFMSETSMGSPLVYPIRNQALSVIETLCGKQFSKSEKVKALEDGLTVYWWDWTPFLQWWEKRRGKGRLW